MVTWPNLPIRAGWSLVLSVWSLFLWVWSLFLKFTVARRFSLTYGLSYRTSNTSLFFCPSTCLYRIVSMMHQLWHDTFYQLFSWEDAKFVFCLSVCLKVIQGFPRLKIIQGSSSMSLHTVPWACMQLKDLICSSMSLHAIKRAHMQLACSSMS